MRIAPFALDLSPRNTEKVMRCCAILAGLIWSLLGTTKPLRAERTPPIESFGLVKETLLLLVSRSLNRVANFKITGRLLPEPVPNGHWQFAFASSSGAQIARAKLLPLSDLL